MFRRNQRRSEGDGPVITGFLDFELIGAGGFSKVYTAYQERLARTVAVKIVTVELSADASRRFEREQQTAGQLDGHPNVIRIYESGFTDDGRPYLVMEHHSAGSLADRVRRHGPLPVDEVLDIGVKLAGALDAAHRRGIVHRDVKPQNVLVSSFAGPVLADFGIAALDPGRFTVTTEAFSVNHAAPEVLGGAPATSSSDLYSLASLLYELLAGRAPFADPERPELLALIRRVQADPIPPIGRPDLSPEMEAGLLGLLARDPANRPADGAAMAERLDRLRGGSGPAGGGPVATSAPGLVPDRSPWAPPAEDGDSTIIPPPRQPPDEQPRSSEPLQASPPKEASPAVPGRPTSDGAAPTDTDGTVLRPANPAPPPSPLTEADAARRRWIIPVVVGAVVLLLAGTGLVFFGGEDESKPEVVATTSTTLALDGFGACPEPVTEAPPLPFTSTEAPEDVAVEVTGDETSATVTWADTNDGNGYYVVYARCNAPDAQPVPVEFVPPGGEATVVVDGLDIEGNYCFAVGAFASDLSELAPGEDLALNMGDTAAGDTYDCLDDP